MDFLNLDTNNAEENKNDSKFQKLDSWFSFMNTQFKELEESHEKGKINNLLIDNDIPIIE